MSTTTATPNIVEGPRGFKMPEPLARRIEDIAKSAGVKPDDYRRKARTPSEFKLEDGSRTDVSTVTTDAIDHDGEVVLHKGIDLSVYRENLVVMFAHKYDQLQVGKCLWIKSNSNGMVAATQYAKRPDTYGNNVEWLPDAIVSLMQEDMCKGKSIGFIPTEYRDPTKAEVAARPELQSCKGVIARSTLLEYSVAPIPANSQALSFAVSKSISDAMVKTLFGDAVPEPVAAAVGAEPDKPEIIIPFITEATIRRSMQDRIERLKALAPLLIEQHVRDAWDRACGRI